MNDSKESTNGLKLYIRKLRFGEMYFPVVKLLDT